MATEQDKTLKGLQLAIQMEKDGKAFYQKASENTQNHLGKQLLATLSKEEDLHLQKFQQIYNSILQKKGWPAVKADFNSIQKTRTLFSQASRQEELKGMAAPGEINAVLTGLDMEAKSYDLYQKQAKAASSDAEKNFYLAVAAEEHQHQLSLNEYNEYLKDPNRLVYLERRTALDRG